MKRKKVIGITGVCCSGKTVLAEELRKLGYEAKEIAQEHSSVPGLWEQVQVDFLVVLDCSYETIKKRRDVAWPQERLDHQREALAGAITGCDLYLNTDGLSPDQVLNQVVKGCKEKFAFGSGS